MSRELTEKLLKAFTDTGDMHMSYRELAVISAKEIEQAQAEVLAAAITLFADREPHHRAWAEQVRLLRKLQPAAKALEELLREEWNKAIEASCEEIEKLKQRIMLEKARAEGKG